MSKRKQARTAYASLVVALIALASQMNFFNAQAQTGATQAGEPKATATNAKAAAVAAATAEVLHETSEIRKLKVLRDVQSGTKTRDEIERMILRNLDEEQKPEELRASALTLKKLGLVPQDFEYRSFLVKLLGEQVAGFYDPKTQRFYLADWIAENLDGFKPVMAHELTHALQDQHFDLRRFEHWRKGDSDAELAAHALIEGDATLLMQLYVTRSPSRLLSMLAATRAMGATATEQIDKAPRALRQTLVFPYE